MYKYLRYLKVFLLILFVSCSNISQKTEAKIDVKNIEKLISIISWDSFEITTNYGLGLKVLDESVKNLEKMGKKISPYLLNSLKDEDKTVIIHIMLTNLWEPELNFLNVHYNGDSDSKDSIVEFMINNLKWYQSYDGKNNLDNIDVNRIYKYWKKRTTE